MHSFSRPPRRGEPRASAMATPVVFLNNQLSVSVVVKHVGCAMPAPCQTYGFMVSCEKCPRSSGTRVPTGTCVESVAFLAGTGHVLCSTECQASSLTSAGRPDTPPAPCVSPSSSLVERSCEETCGASRSHLVVDGRGTRRRCKSVPRRALRELELCHARANRSRWSRTVLGSRLLRTWSR